MSGMGVSLRRAGLIVFIGLLAFYNVPGNSFHYDDEHSILENPHLRSLANAPNFFVDASSFSGLHEARMYRPLLLLSFAFNYAIGQYDPLSYHLVNIALHIVNALLVWRLAWALGAREGPALAAGLLFVVHPVLTEPVNYISSRSSLLVTLFVILAFMQLVRRRPSWKVALAYGAALLCKSSAIAFPALVLAWLWTRSEMARWRILLLPVALSVGYVIATRAIVGKALLEPVRDYLSHFSTQCKALVFYVYTAIMPVSLSVEPQFAVSPHPGQGGVLWALLVLVSLAMVVLMQRRKGLATFALAWFFLALLPPSLVPLNVLVNEHRLYMPMVGVALLLASAPLRAVAMTYVGWGALLLALLLCVERNRDWQSPERLWSDAVEKGPHMPRPLVNLSQVLLETGRVEESIAASRRALNLRPDLERAHYNLGTAYMQQNLYELAEAHLRRALDISPQLLPAYNNLGNIYVEQGRFDAALEQYRLALQQAEYASIYHNMGSAHLKAGRADSAQVYFRRALAMDAHMREAYIGLFKGLRGEDRLNQAIVVLEQALTLWPGDETLLLLLGESYAGLGKDEQARAVYRQLGKSPGEAWGLLGAEALRRGNWQRAHDYLQRALEKKKEASFYNDLGAAQFGLGQVEAALQSFRAAARIDPQLARAFANIGRVYLQYGRLLDATAALERAVALDEQDGHFRALLGQTYEHAGKLAEAVEWYRGAVQRAPEKVAYYNNLAFLYQQLGRSADAKRLYILALERDAEHVETLFNLGLLYLDEGLYAQVAAVYQKIISINPGHIDAQVNLATAWINTGQRPEALAVYENVLALDIDAALRAKISAQVRALSQP
jgi:tetratricopeptide (TPR) repeat protein